MKTVSITPAAADLTSLLEQARDEDLVVQLPDGSQFLLAAVEEDDFDEEIARTRKNEKLMAFLDERRKETTTVPLAEVRRQLGI